MSTLPPQPARRSYTNPAPTSFDDDDYGTSDFLSPETPRVVFGAAGTKTASQATVAEAPAKPVRPSYIEPNRPVRPAAPSFSKPAEQPAPVAQTPVAPAPAPAPAPVAQTPVAPAPEVPAPATAQEITAHQPTPLAPRPGVAVTIDNALQQAPALIDNAIQQAPALIGNIVDHYSEQGKKDRLSANVLTGSALATVISGVFGPMMFALPIILAGIGLAWGKKARRNGMSTTLSSLMGWTTIGVSISGIALWTALGWVSLHIIETIF